MIVAAMSSDYITVVSGLPRSGTSLMMQMVQAGGIPVISDGQRSPDADNPKGYLEFEAVKKLKEDSSWLDQANGKVVKVISMLLYDLPPQHQYRVIFMLRDMNEILASQKEMLKRRKALRGHEPGDEEMRTYFEHHLEKVRGWLAQQPNIRVLYVDYNEIMRGSDTGLQDVCAFLGQAVSLEAMKKAVDAGLYRNRARV